VIINKLPLPHSIRHIQIATITRLEASSEQYNTVFAADNGHVTTVVSSVSTGHLVEASVLQVQWERGVHMLM